MQAPDRQTVTRILREMQDGRSSVSELLAIVYEDLRRQARVYVRRASADGTLQATALVHEVAGRLLDKKAVSWNDRAHFFAVAGQAMRQILANRARDRRAEKRGGGWQRVTLAAVSNTPGEVDLDLLALDEALTELAAMHERMAKVVEQRFFAGMTVKEIAHVLAVSVSTIEEDWRTARAWLARKLRRDGRPETA